MACRANALDRQTNASIEKGKTNLLLTNATIVTVNETRDVVFDGAMAVVDGRVENCLLLELLTDQGIGTEIAG